MSFLRDLVELIVVPPGDMIYHLATLFAIQLVLALALGHWNRHRRDPAALRLLVLGIVLTLTRTQLMLVAVLDQIGILSSYVILPPLERFFDLTTLLLVVWAFLPILTRKLRQSTIVLLISILIAAGMYVAFAILWPQDEAQAIIYNGYWQERVWEILSIAVIGLGLVASLVWREGNWSLLTFPFGLWFIGHILQLAVPPFIDSHTAGWVRLANLAALPLVASATYSRVLHASPIAARRGNASSAIISILEAVQSVDTEPDTEAALRRALPSIARALGADMVAVGLPISGSLEELRIVALHPSNGTLLPTQEPTLLISKHPLLAAALRTGNVQRVGMPISDPAVSTLYRRLGFERPGPLLALPLTSNGVVLGIILAGNLISKRNWTARGQHVFQAVGAALATALTRAPGLEVTDDGAELWEARDKAHRLTQRASELEAKLEQQRQRAEELATTMRLREQKESSLESQVADEATFWQKEIRDLIDARAAMETELAEWKEKAEQLLKLSDKLQEQLTQAQVQLYEARSQGQATSLTSYKQAIDSLGPQAILIGDEEGNIILANQGARFLIGQLRTALEGTPLQSLFTDRSWIETVNTLLESPSQDKDSASVPLHLNGRRMRAELTRIPNIAGGMGTLAVMFYPAEELTIQDDTVLSMIHELRTPMTSITSYTELLLGESVGILGEMQRQFLQRVNANVERMTALLEDLAKVTSIDAGDVSLSPEPADILKVIEDAIMSLSPQFSERDLGVQMDMPSQLPPIRADRDSLYQIVLHLLSNAGQCSLPGTEVVIRARLEEYQEEMDGLPDYLFMSVTDTGGGIIAEDQKRVFQRLYRADNPSIDGLGDNGVGLSVAKALVETQGGRIWVESEMGMGSTFSFILPLSSPAPPDDDGNLSFDQVVLN